MFRITVFISCSNFSTKNVTCHKICKLLGILNNTIWKWWRWSNFYSTRLSNHINSRKRYTKNLICIKISFKNTLRLHNLIPKIRVSNIIWITLRKTVIIISRTIIISLFTSRTRLIVLLLRLSHLKEKVKRKIRKFFRRIVKKNVKIYSNIK